MHHSFPTEIHFIIYIYLFYSQELASSQGTKVNLLQNADSIFQWQ